MRSGENYISLSPIKLEVAMGYSSYGWDISKSLQQTSVKAFEVPFAFLPMYIGTQASVLCDYKDQAKNVIKTSAVTFSQPLSSQ